MTAPKAATTLSRRLKARQMYRRKRDQKIAVDLLGREFVYSYRDELGTLHSTRLRMVSYDPVIHNITLQFVPYVPGESVVWTTDTFWRLRRTDLLEDA